MKNEYTIVGNTAFIKLNRRNGNPIFTRVSIEDLPIINSFKGAWNAQYDKTVNGYYVAGNITKEDGRPTTVKLHTFIMRPSKGLQIDHINHDTLDNTRKNLRIVTNAQNSQNRKGAYKNNNSSKIRGVDWSKARGKWRARVTINYKQYNLGYFDNTEDAKKAVVDFRLKHMKYTKEAV